MVTDCRPWIAEIGNPFDVQFRFEFESDQMQTVWRPGSDYGFNVVFNNVFLKKCNNWLCVVNVVLAQSEVFKVCGHCVLRNGVRGN